MISKSSFNFRLLTSVSVLLLTVVICTAQRSVNCNGGDVTGKSGSMSYTVGQIDYSIIESVSGQASLGVQQPVELIKSGETMTLSCVVYPNPANTELHLQSDDSDYQLFNYSLFDLEGRLLVRENGVSINKSIQIEKLPTGTYVLYVSNAKKDELTCKFVKITP